MILVTVQEARDLQLARALLAALGARFEFYLLFASRELSEQFGTPPCRHGTDTSLCLLNPQNFELVVSFSGARDAAHVRSLRLLSLFDEIGIVTLELQHTLFQYGIDDEHPSGLNVGYAARKVVPWGGADGVGYLKSELRQPAASEWGTDFVLVTSSEAPDARSSKHHYQFAIALLKLAAARPEQRFVWAEEPAAASDEAASALSLVQEYRLANLGVERSIPAEQLVPLCSAGISMFSTVLIDHQLHRKPLLLYACDRVAQLSRRLHAQTFASEAELQCGFERLRAEPQRYLVDTKIGRLDVERLEAALREACASSSLSPEWLRIALRALPELQSGALEEARSDVHALLSHELQRVLERIGVLQRSTLAYKAKKLAVALRGKTGG